MRRLLMTMLCSGLALVPTARAAEGPRGSLAPAAFSFSAGLGSSHAYNLVGVTAEWMGSDQVGLYATAGLGGMLVGVGGIWYENRRGEGFVASAVVGTGFQAALTYQFKLDREASLAVGLSYIHGFAMGHRDRIALGPVIGYQRRF